MRIFVGMGLKLASWSCLAFTIGITPRFTSNTVKNIKNIKNEQLQKTQVIIYELKNII